MRRKNAARAAAALHACGWWGREPLLFTAVGRRRGFPRRSTPRAGGFFRRLSPGSEHNGRYVWSSPGTSLLRICHESLGLSSLHRMRSLSGDMLFINKTAWRGATPPGGLCIFSEGAGRAKFGVPLQTKRARSVSSRRTLAQGGGHVAFDGFDAEVEPLGDSLVESSS